MRLLEIISEARNHLQENGRVSLRVLRRQFELEDARRPRQRARRVGGTHRSIGRAREAGAADRCGDRQGAQRAGADAGARRRRAARRGRDRRARRAAHPGTGRVRLRAGALPSGRVHIQAPTDAGSGVRDAAARAPCARARGARPFSRVGRPVARGYTGPARRRGLLRYRHRQIRRTPCASERRSLLTSARSSSCASWPEALRRTDRWLGRGPCGRGSHRRSPAGPSGRPSRRSCVTAGPCARRRLVAEAGR